MSTTPTIDILAIAAHRDDVEQTCGGTLLAMHARGWRTGILDLTQGESGTRGTAANREAEANAAASILNVAHREALDLPDGNVENTLANRLKLAAVLRRLRPRVVILPYWQGRHPDHYTTATLGYEACFVSGLAKVVTPGEAALMNGRAPLCLTKAAFSRAASIRGASMSFTLIGPLHAGVLRCLRPGSATIRALEPG